MSTWRRLGGCALLLGLVGVAVRADAVTTSTYAQWDPLTGTANNYSSGWQVAVPGFPPATMASDSRAGSVGVQSGASTWFGENTPVGVTYGSSRNQPYMSLRAKADSATNPSVTTYTFAHPTPPTGWMIAFSDIDADQVRVIAKDAGGADVSAAELGFRGSFNFCDTTPRPSTCATSIGDVPTWNPVTQTLVGNPQALDTVGASGWFEPTVPLSSITAIYTRRSGLPLYSTSFAALARTIGGRVTDVTPGSGSCPVTGVTLRLLSPYGEDLGTRTPDSNGDYSFGQVATQPGYQVFVEPPASCAAVGGVSRTVSTSSADATAAFSVRQIIPQPVSGTVRADGKPLEGVTVTLHAPDGTSTSTTTEPDGTYLLDDNAIADGYFVSIDVPPGYTGTDQRAPFDIDSAPITGQDFALAADPDVSGTVSGGGDGLGGATVTLTPTTGPEVSTVTAADGTYTFARVTPGTYSISVDPPIGFSPTAPLSGVVVSTDDVTGQDFALARPGAIGGMVTDANDNPVEGAEVTVDGPGQSQMLTTDRAGQFFLDGLDAGTYAIDLAPPPGFIAVGPDEQTVVITDAGEVRGGIDFEVTPSETSPGPSSSPSPSPSATGSGSSTGASTAGGVLPDTGSPLGPPLPLAALLLVGGGALLVAASMRGRRR